jgi:peptidyl-prolyl cis-trans isomerase C
MELFPNRLALALVAGLLTQASFAAEPVATVNGIAIPAERADILRADLEQRNPEAAGDPRAKEFIRADLIRRAVIEDAATKSGLDKRPDTILKVDIARQTVLIQSYLQNWVKNNPVTDAEVKKEYDAIKVREAKEYHSRHVLLSTEEAAKAVIDKLKKGTKIADLAKDSLDTGSKDKGGDLEWSSASAYVPPFAEALRKLEKGKYTTTPVKTDFGYHVIYLEDVRNRAEPFPPLDEIKQQLQQNLQQQKIDVHIKGLVDKANVK